MKPKALSPESVKDQLKRAPDWKLLPDGKTIRREWQMKDFPAAVDLIIGIRDLAEAMDHHPDLHLTGYRRLAAELSTHSIEGLSENDFVLAAQIEGLPKSLKV